MHSFLEYKRFKAQRYQARLTMPYPLVANQTNPLTMRLCLHSSWSLYLLQTNIWKAQQMTALLLLSSSFLSHMMALLLLLSSFLSQMTALHILSSFLSQWLHLKPSPQQLLQQPWLRLMSPQQWQQQQKRYYSSLTTAFCIPPRARLTMQLQEISCCFSFKTTQQLQYQVFCCLAILNAQQLWWRLMQIFCCFLSEMAQQVWWRLSPTSHFSWLLLFFAKSPSTSVKIAEYFVRENTR